LTPTARTSALSAVLYSVPAHAPVDRLDRLWIFAPRDLGNRETGLLVVSLLPLESDEPDQRQILVIRYEAQGREAPSISVTEEGVAPAERIPRVIAGVVARLDDPDEPVEQVIGGNPEAWLEVLGGEGRHVDPPSRE
jgi:hypothetical protein